MKPKRTSARRQLRPASKARRRTARPVQQAAAIPPVNHPEPYVSVIIPAMNEERTIRGVIAEARGVHSRCEVIVIVNGSADRTAEMASSSGARVISYEQPLGHDAGRSVGAEAAMGEVLLFLDGDFVIPASKLRPFVRAVNEGADIALNGYSGPVRQAMPHPVVLSKHALNLLLGRPDLKGSSMTAVPHALSRRALAVLGSGLLSRPPLAHAAAVTTDLRVQAVHTVEVGKLNSVRRKAGGSDPLQQQIVEDHLEAVSLLLERRGHRAGFGDGSRRREIVR
ncbi:glycosyltransferase family 2 protein [Paenibacillus agri]|uniref:4,4'-diaponeurosporenoate glycosyltransferase n=1 Tax=Paenibacillus agri TaxID=2744309 RepID=A0A850EGP2_9BACL|nr:glycosyltransferase family 2 protein [Paenibacillus agri]NUU60305.1 glycosyltransferase family 2 protein [Paenibacillus agri]